MKNTVTALPFCDFVCVEISTVFTLFASAVARGRYADDNARKGETRFNINIHAQYRNGVGMGRVRITLRLPCLDVLMND